MTWVWGIDVDVRAAHFGFHNPETGEEQTNAVEWGDNHESPVRRLMECHAQVTRFASRMADLFPPVTIAVERPTGKFPSPPLMMHAGVIAEAVGGATCVPPWFLGIGEWRKASVGRGNCTKDDVVEWARHRGWRFSTVDQAEALGIAVAAASIWTPEEVAA